MPEEQTLLHASCVALDGKAVAICGASGRGKSELALQLMAFGATLVADDGTMVTRRPENGLWVSCPPSIKGRIEARGIGILAADCVPQARLRLVVDLDVKEEQRLPPDRKITLLGEEVDLLLRVEHVHFAAAVFQYLKAGRVA